MGQTPRAAVIRASAQDRTDGLLCSVASVPSGDLHIGDLPLFRRSSEHLSYQHTDLDLSGRENVTYCDGEHSKREQIDFVASLDHEEPARSQDRRSQENVCTFSMQLLAEIDVLFAELQYVLFDFVLCPTDVCLRPTGNICCWLTVVDTP